MRHEVMRLSSVLDSGKPIERFGLPPCEYRLVDSVLVEPYKNADGVLEARRRPLIFTEPTVVDEDNVPRLSGRFGCLYMQHTPS
jgi:hypothetical protein